MLRQFKNNSNPGYPVSEFLKIKIIITFVWQHGIVEKDRIHFPQPNNFRRNIIFTWKLRILWHIMIKTLLLVGTGGFLGSISRFLASRFIQENFPQAFPLGTFLVNITGCFLIGLIYGFSERSSLLTSGWKMFLAVGFCGGFTTFSTFANENLALLRDGEFFLFSALYRVERLPGYHSYIFGSYNNQIILKI